MNTLDYDDNDGYSDDDPRAGTRMLGCVLLMLFVFLFVLIIGGFALLASGAL
jgi:hypothetical protein